MNTDKNRDERPEAYPRPSKNDQQVKNQPEFIDQQPNDFHDKSISDISQQPGERQNNDPGPDLKE